MDSERPHPCEVDNTFASDTRMAGQEPSSPINAVIHSGDGMAAAAAPAQAPAPVPQIDSAEKNRPATSIGLPATRQLKLAVTRVVIVFATLFTVRYFYWRTTATMNPAARWFFYVFIVAEVLNFLEALLFYVTTWSPTRYATPTPMAGRSVDVFITTYDEPVELLRETVLCATNINYPHKTFLLDDGNRPQVRQLAEEFGCGYLARSERRHAKAGNLNNALANTQGEFIVTLDADHVPAPDLVEKLIGFFRDQKVAAVQTDQSFYNLDSFQHRMNWKTRAGWQQQELFFSVIQPGKDRFGAAFYCGSPAILRRSAIEGIGGFATESITEDMHTGLRLQKKMWRVLYHNKTLAYGLAPQTFIGFATQWQRWGSGCMQVMRIENPIFGQGLSLGQRLCYFASMYFYWMSYQKLLYLLTPIVALLSGIFPLITTPKQFAEFFLPYLFFNLFASVLLQGGFTGYFRSEQFNVLKMHVLMRTIVGLIPLRTGFKVTPKSRADAAGITDVLLPMVLCVLLAASIVVGLVRLSSTNDEFLLWAVVVNISWGGFYLFMITGVLWSAVRRREMRAMYRFPARLDIRATVRFTAENGNPVESTDYARNLNRGGLSVTLDQPIKTGTAVEIELQLGERLVRASGEVVRNESLRIKGKVRVANGIRFCKIDIQDQDEISKYLFWQIAPREQCALKLTHMSQREA
jgi:cellulose synthase/poly-beta-1,6-N-acetylglucosamine synthase-like glycosyltransferase